MKTQKPKKVRLPQKQVPPGKQSQMKPLPKTKSYLKPSEKLKGKVAIITGGDSGIGQAIAHAFAKEGAHIVITYLKEHKDAQHTKELVEGEGSECLVIPGDAGNEKFCQRVIKETFRHFNRIDILVNNCAEQHPQKSISDITEKQLEKTFRTNIFSYFFMTKAAIKFLEKTKGNIINTSSVTAYRGSKELLDYSSTKGAIVAFTRSLSLALADKGIRVNGVAPGPVWTPLIPSTFRGKKVETFGSDVPLKRAGEPNEISPCFVFLASEDAAYITGQFLHPNGGEIVNT